MFNSLRGYKVIKKAKAYCLKKAKTTAAKVTGTTAGLITLLSLIFTFINHQDDQLSAKMLENKHESSRGLETMYKYVDSNDTNLNNRMLDINLNIKDAISDVKDRQSNNLKEIRATRRDIQGLQRLILEFHTDKGN